jgi:integrase
MDDCEYLFQSKKGNNQPIQRMQAWRILNDVARKVGIKGEIGTHSLRKTFGYHMYKHCKGDVTIVQKFLNHSSPSVTLRYIGITQDSMDDLIDSFCI